MQDHSDDELKEHRAIGINYALNFFKDEELIDPYETFPDKAARYVKKRTELMQERKYKLGARDCAIELLESFNRGDFVTVKKEDGKYEIECHVDSFKWVRKISKWSKDDEETVETKEYELTPKELGFEG